MPTPPDATPEDAPKNVPANSPESRALALARSFHSLAHLTEWDPEALDDWASGKSSHGEKLAVQFVLSIYNQFHEWRCGRFDLVEAYGVWDRDHWAAFSAWVADPFML